jgi:hypothetical protein
MNSAGAVLCLLAAFAAAFFGLVLASQATIGVGLVGVGCLLGITARMLQAEWQYKRPKTP